MRFPVVCTLSLFLVVVSLRTHGEGFAVAEEPTHQQKVDMARRIAAMPIYQQEFATQEDPQRFARLSDSQVEARLATTERKLSAAQAEHHAAETKLKAMEASHAQTKRMTAAQVRKSLAPNLLQQRTLVNRAYDGMRRQVIAKAELLDEMRIRKNPDVYFKRLRSLHDSLRTARDWRKTITKMIDQHAKAYGSKPVMPGSKLAKQQTLLAMQGCPYRKGGSTTGRPVPGYQAPPGTGKPARVAVETRHLFPKGTPPSTVSAFSQERLTSQSKALAKCPLSARKLLAFGGYEQVQGQELRASSSGKTKTVGQVVETACQTGSAERIEMAYKELACIAPGGALHLGNQTRAAAAESVAWGMVMLIQSLGDHVFEKKRKRLFKEALEEVMQSIPKGQREMVILIEEVETFVADPYVFHEPMNVTALRGEVEIARQGEVLDNLRKSYNNTAWHRYNLYEMQVVGVGNAVPSVDQAYRAGLAVGRLARSTKLEKGVLEENYKLYNRWPETQEAFKRGWREASSGKKR